VFAGVPPTGRAVTFGAIDILRVANGQITDLWHVEDNLALLIQLGAVPPFET
jgi:predicted ester cyclase